MTHLMKEASCVDFFFPQDRVIPKTVSSFCHFLDPYLLFFLCVSWARPPCSNNPQYKSSSDLNLLVPSEFDTIYFV